MELRAHNLLCIHGFVGRGYSPEFVANMTRVIESLGNDAPVTVTASPDVLCSACPNLTDAGCVLHGEGSEAGIVNQDRDVMGRLGIEEGALLAWGDVVVRIAASIAPDDLDSICGSCPWLPLGVCKSGISDLRNGKSY